MSFGRFAIAGLVLLGFLCASANGRAALLRPRRRDWLTMAWLGPVGGFRRLSGRRTSTSVMFGGIFNLATEGLGRYVPVASGVFMSMVLGGGLLSVQGALADRIGILNSYWMSIALLAYIAWYAVFGSKVTKRADGAEVAK